MQQRDILLVPFPFSDLSGSKVRPVLVLSNDQYNAISDDLIVCGITSVARKDYAIPLRQADLAQGAIHESCTIKVDKLLKINKTLIRKSIGTLKPTVFAQVKEILLQVF